MIGPRRAWVPIRRLSLRMAGQPVHRWQHVPVVLAFAAAIEGAGFIVTGGRVQATLASTSAVTFLVAALAHAATWRGPGWALWGFASAGACALVAEVIGVRTGVPFGAYTYVHAPGWRVAGVPLLVPAAWVMMAYPAGVIGRRATAHPFGQRLVATAALLAWDLVLDPTMVRAGWWQWHGIAPAWVGIPLSNFAGWTWTSLVVVCVIWRGCPQDGRAVDDRVPVGLYVGMGAWCTAQALAAGIADAALLGGGIMGGLASLAMTRGEGLAVLRGRVTPRRLLLRGSWSQRAAYGEQHEPKRVA